MMTTSRLLTINASTTKLIYLLLIASSSSHLQGSIATRAKPRTLLWKRTTAAAVTPTLWSAASTPWLTARTRDSTTSPRGRTWYFYTHYCMSCLLLLLSMHSFRSSLYHYYLFCVLYIYIITITTIILMGDIITMAIPTVLGPQPFHTP